MRRTLMKSKIHRATVTGADLHYEGSISIDPALCDSARLLPYERVEIYNVNNGERFNTYVIHGDPGEIRLNGAAARKVHRGDLIIIASYAEFEEHECHGFKPWKVFVNAKNQMIDPPIGE
jgi:aspartate 1-decarboxylase